MSLFSEIVQDVDVMAEAYVFNAFELLTGEYAEMIRLSLVLFVMGYGLIFFKGRLEWPDFIWKMIWYGGAVWGLTQWGHFSGFIYEVFVHGPTHMIGVLSQGDDPMERFFLLLNAIMRIVKQLLWEGSLLDGILMTGFGFAYAIIGWILMAIGLFMVVVGKSALALVLGVGPMFILFVLFESTRGMFQSWLSALSMLAFMQVLVAGVIIFAIELMLPDIKRVAINLGSGLEADLKSTRISSHIVLMVVAGGLLIAMAPLASHLSNGLRIHVGSVYHANENAIRRMTSALQNAGKTFQKVYQKVQRPASSIRRGV